MSNSNNMHKYDDIINLPHYTSSKRPRMAMIDRAAQFSPFAALTGYDAAVKETARLTEDWVELDEYQKSALNDRLQILQERLSNTPVISITYFVPDERKSGGAYCTETGITKKMDKNNRFTELLKAHKSTIYTVCYMFSDNKEEVEDLFQEVSIRIWQGYDGFRGEASGGGCRLSLS